MRFHPISDAARVWGVTPETARRWLDERQIPYLRLPHIRVRWCDLAGMRIPMLPQDARAAYTFEQIAELLNVSCRTVTSWCARGMLQRGHGRTVKTYELERFLHDNTVNPLTPFSGPEGFPVSRG